MLKSTRNIKSITDMEIDEITNSFDFLKAEKSKNFKNNLLTDEHGNTFSIFGRLHSFEDEPALKKPDGTLVWYKHGSIHRLNGPAVISPDGSVEYYEEGKLHRFNNPAVIWADGSVAYYQHGIKHRNNGPAIHYSDGIEVFYRNGIFRGINYPDGRKYNATMSLIVEKKDIKPKKIKKEYIRRGPGPGRPKKFFNRVMIPKIKMCIFELKLIRKNGRPSNQSLLNLEIQYDLVVKKRVGRPTKPIVSLYK